MSKRACISRSTLVRLEKGDAGIGLGHLINVLIALGLEKDLLLVAKDDELGRKLQDAGLITKKRAPKK